MLLLLALALDKYHKMLPFTGVAVSLPPFIFLISLAFFVKILNRDITRKFVVDRSEYIALHNPSV